MGLDAVIEAGEIRHQVMRGAHGGIAEEPEEGGFLSVLGDDLGYGFDHRAARSGMRWPKK